MQSDDRRTSRLSDVLAAASLISQFIEEKTFAEYMQDTMLRSAVERQFITIGEALNVLLRLAPGASPRITSHRRIIEFRNRLVHRYFNIDQDIVWNVITEHLPILEQEVSALLHEFEES